MMQITVQVNRDYSEVTNLTTFKLEDTPITYTRFVSFRLILNHLGFFNVNEPSTVMRGMTPFIGINEEDSAHFEILLTEEDDFNVSDYTFVQLINQVLKVSVSNIACREMMEG